MAQYDMAKLKEAWAVIDTDNSGALSGKELANVLKAYDESFKQEDKAAALEKACEVSTFKVLFINCKAWEIMYLVVSVRPFVCLSVRAVLF